jgi:SPASM domain peptide maturase of grasp-with-spasm system
MSRIKKKRFKLFANCLITSGYFRSIIVDTQRSGYYLVPHSLVQLFDTNLCIAALPQNSDRSSVNIYNEYISHLVREELVFEVFEEEIELFPAIDTTFIFPSSISNVIIDVNYHVQDFYRIAMELQSINCLHLQLRFFCALDLRLLQVILDKFKECFLQSIDVVVPFCAKVTHKVLKDICAIVTGNKLIRTFYIGSSPINKVLTSASDGVGLVVQTKSSASSILNCGIVSKDYFNFNLMHFTESQHHNTCLNRKISIDEHGEIRNCPSMPKSWGNIKDTKLIDVVNNPEFQKLWHIKKDEITKCKDCEFRHICTDCRAYRENPDDLYSAPLKCGYDPYTGVWEEWSTNPLKQKAIEFSGMEELVKERQDKLKIKN